MEPKIKGKIADSDDNLVAFFSLLMEVDKNLGFPVLRGITDDSKEKEDYDPRSYLNKI